MDTKLAVLEGKWFKDRNTSIKGVVDLIADLQYQNPHCYHYEMFCNDAAFKSIINRLGKLNDIRLIYVAAHGYNGGIQGTDETIITQKQLLNSVVKLNTPALGMQKGKRVDGIFFGSCSFMTEDTAKKFLEDTSIKWIAGYCKDVDWIKSTICDLFFWNTYLLEHHNDDENTVLAAIKKTAAEINNFIQGANTLGMRIYIRKPGGGISQLIQ